MKALIMLAKAAIAFVWLVLILNIFMPFPGNAAIALYIMTAFFVHHARFTNGHLHWCIWRQNKNEQLGKIFNPDFWYFCPTRYSS